MYEKHFASLESFLRAVKPYEKYFHQCIECRMVRLIREISAETASFLKCFLDEFNGWAPTKPELESLGVEISHGSCKLCMRERLMALAPKRQARQGFRDCFGTAMEGHCSENGSDGRPPCIYIGVCPITKEEELAWRKWKAYRANTNDRVITSKPALVIDYPTSSNIQSGGDFIG